VQRLEPQVDPMPEAPMALPIVLRVSLLAQEQVENLMQVTDLPQRLVQRL
jgi:hypothetical protein